MAKTLMAIINVHCRGDIQRWMTYDGKYKVLSNKSCYSTSPNNEKPIQTAQQLITNTQNNVKSFVVAKVLKFKAHQDKSLW